MLPPDSAETVHLKPIEIWYLYKTKILTYGGIILAGLVIFASVQIYQYQITSGSQSLYEKAQTASDFQAVLQKYPGTPAAGNAALRLADKLRAEKKYDESVTVLRGFIANYPQHPLAAGGWTSLAATYEMQGKLDEALQANQQGIAKFPEAYTTPIAMMSQARIYRAKGQNDDARRIYQDVSYRFPQSIYAQEASRELHFLKK